MVDEQRRMKRREFSWACNLNISSWGIWKRTYVSWSATSWDAKLMPKFRNEQRGSMYADMHTNKFTSLDWKIGMDWKCKSRTASLDNVFCHCIFCDSFKHWSFVITEFQAISLPAETYFICISWSSLLEHQGRPLTVVNHYSVTIFTWNCPDRSRMSVTQPQWSSGKVRWMYFGVLLVMERITSSWRQKQHLETVAWANRVNLILRQLWPFQKYCDFTSAWLLARVNIPHVLILYKHTLLHCVQ